MVAAALIVVLRKDMGAPSMVTVAVGTVVTVGTAAKTAAMAVMVAAAAVGVAVRRHRLRMMEIRAATVHCPTSSSA